jgi:hypothetical protein
VSYQKPLDAGTSVPLTLDRLCFGEQLLVWAWRVAIEAATGHPLVWRELREGFALAGAEEGAAAAEQAVTIAASTSRRKLDIRCVNCRMVGGDEARLTLAVAAFQACRFDLADRLVCDFELPSSAHRIAGDSLCLLARELAGAGLHLPRRTLMLPVPDRVSAPALH